MLEVQINGEQRRFDDVTCVADLVRALALEGRRMALEKNGEIVPKSFYAGTPLQSGDVLEIVVAVGGG